MKKLIYIACPYTQGDVAVNVHKAIVAANEIAYMGAIPYVPIWTHFWHLITPKPWEFWIKLDSYFVGISDALLRLPGESRGADREVGQADILGIPVFYQYDDLRKWLEIGE